MKPILYVCAGPIGNLEDFTFRAVRILKEEVEAIFCEDTRQSYKLLKHYGIDKKTYSCHSHSSDKTLEFASGLMEKGKSIAYLTDCGTPGISDPGSKLVHHVKEKGFTVSPLPGASALTGVVSICGFPGKNVIFAGFISKKGGKKRNELLKLKEFQGIIVFYESPHRILKTLEAIKDVFPGQKVCIGRELTKLHEEIITDNIDEIFTNSDKITVKGEFVISIDNN